MCEGHLSSSIALSLGLHSSESSYDNTGVHVSRKGVLYGINRCPNTIMLANRQSGERFRAKYRQSLSTEHLDSRHRGNVAYQ